jgi:uncharacterized protein (TIGR01777 family)
LPTLAGLLYCAVMDTGENIPRHVLITGGTGFIGSALSARLLDAGVEVSVLTRDRHRAQQRFKSRVRAVVRLDELDNSTAPDVIVNLAGKNLGSERWSRRVKRELVASRVNTTRRICDYIAAASVKPRLLISGSAVGYYGARGDEELTEASSPGEEYQSRLCQRWEHAALEAEEQGVRVCISRTGVVLGRGGGALSALAPQFRWGLGAVVGSGRQWISWIHMHDLLEVFLRFMRDDGLQGVFNNTAPHPVTNRDFASHLGRAVKRPVALRVPGWLLRPMLGEMAHLYLTGQKVIPERHLQAGFAYRYPHIAEALEAALP